MEESTGCRTKRSTSISSSFRSHLYGSCLYVLLLLIVTASSLAGNWKSKLHTTRNSHSNHLLAQRSIKTSRTNPPSCSDPGIPQHGSRTGSGLYIGSSLQFACNSGYLLRGSEELRCWDRRQNVPEWDAERPQCVEIGRCEDKGDIENGRRIWEGAGENNTVNFVCDEGYLLLGSRQLRCNNDGQWTSTWPLCTKAPANCGDPGRISNGRRFVNGTMEGLAVNVQCNQGYILVGDEQRTCLPSGVWSGSAPSCKSVHCEPLSRPKHGSVSYHSTKYGAMATYSCRSGYVLSGARKITCVAAGSWSEPPPQCNRVECELPSHPSNGVVKYKRYLYGSTATYQCLRGFGLIGLSVRTCQANGSWSGDMPSCNSGVCNTLSDPINGRVNVTSINLGGIAIYSCNEGYKLSHPFESQRICGLSLVWSGHPQSCEAITCPRLRQITHVSIAMTNQNYYGSIATYTCEFGYVLIGGHDKIFRHCQHTGRWSGQPPNCYEVRCPALNNPQNGMVTITGTGLEDEANYSCQENYQLSFGDQIRTCTQTGKWSGTKPLCIENEVYCEELSTTPTSTVVVTGQQMGDRADYTCNNGLHEMGGISTRICLPSGQWSGDELICSVRCSLLSRPVNGTVRQFGDRPGDTAEYSCDPSYVLVGSDCLECQANGTWSGSPPTCISLPMNPKVCVNLTNPEHGVVDVKEEEHITIAVYTCNEGYVLNGTLEMKCNEGEWTETPPTCQLIDCGVLDPPTNGRVYLLGTLFGSQANFSCDNNHRLVGPDSLECLEEGVWSNDPPICETLQCPEQSSPDGGEVVAPNRMVGSLARYSCTPGYRLVGPMEIRCLESEMWSAEPPICQLITCPILPDIDNGLVEVGNNTVGGQAVYRCDPGLVLRGSSARTCGTTGQWTGEPPVCVVVVCPELPPLIANGQVIVTTRTAGSHALYVCSNGYQVQGIIARLCGDDGQWTGVEPVCIRANCDERELVDPVDGRVSHTNNTIGSIAMYSCNIGYRLVGSPTRQCSVVSTVETSWSGEQPICQKIVCPTLSDPVNGMVLVTHNCFGGGALYRCNQGFRQSRGLLQRTCRENSQWDGDEPTCEPLPPTVICRTLSAPTNGEIQISTTTVGSVVLYSCNHGYRLDGPISRQCLADRRWTGSEPTCVFINCGTLTAPANGSVFTLQGTSLNQVATYFCDPGLTLIGGDFRLCQSNSMWSGAPPTCQIIVIDCGPLSDPVNGRVDTPQGTLFGGEAFYSCAEGYEVNGISSRMCLMSRQWSGLEPSCSLIGTVPDSCGDPGIPGNGARELTSTTVGSVIEYSCITGYRLVGDQTRECLVERLWSGALPSCELVTCPFLVLENGQVLGSGQTVGSQVTYFCNFGYSIRRTDVISRECLPSGEWSGSDPMCILDGSFQCEPLPNIANGQVSVRSSRMVGTVAEYNCQPGFSLTGPPTRTCEAGGIWSGLEPACIAIQCVDPGQPLNGRAVTIDFSVGSRVYYMCNDGFQTSDPVISQCTTNGSWSSLPPGCTPVRAISASTLAGNCSGTGSLLDTAGRLCQCVGGELTYCCRYRQDWTTLSPAKKQSYINAVKTVSSSADFKPFYNELVRRYQESFDTIAQYPMSNTSQFMPWHRYFLLEYENLLRMVDPSITIPYWDWTLMSIDPYKSPVFDPVTGFGDTADNTTMCVSSGPFQEGQFVVAPSAKGTCLKREYYDTFQFPSRSLIENDFLSLKASEFEEFHNSMVLLINLNVRCHIGGHMCTFDAANDPLYLLQLSRSDIMWDRWQRTDSERATVRYRADQKPLVLSFDNSLTVSDFSDNLALPYGVCVQYQPLQPVTEDVDKQITPSSGPDLPVVSPFPHPVSSTDPI